MSEFRAELKYAESHEWLKIESDGSVLLGITDHAQDALGDVVYVELPDVGDQIDAGAEVAVVESVKAASDIYTPISGEVVEINAGLQDDPSMVNSSPYDLGWFMRLKPQDIQSVEDLLDIDGYRALVED
ncbi:MAG: glycine cleavage system protein GcvH [Cellvibrionales bacterium]|jgi:glycine cleavage system H protein|nr:glycine cleavage system protein GcvH [Porticoccaceae bacterium]|tara:strand:- start:11512 stop:11898 length:387 start_codon:yes stop_codon:yes gene_type:complete